jgi:Zn-dependent peptidase ImmA (M78 family)
MIIKDKIQIAGLTYEIRQVHPDCIELNSGNANGLHSFQNCIIFLNESLSEQQKEITLLHELTHAVNDTLDVSFKDINCDERYVESFSRIWHQVMLQIIEWQKEN